MNGEKSMDKIGVKLQVVGAIIISLMLSGCAAQDQVTRVEQGQSQLEYRIRQLQDDVGRLKKQNYAALAARMDQIKVQLSELNGRIETQDHLQFNTDKRVDELKRYISEQSVIVNNLAQDVKRIASKIGMKDIALRKLTPRSAGTGEVTKQPPVSSMEKSTGASVTSTQTAHPAAKKPANQPMTPEAFYKKAFQLFQKREYKAARKTFGEFLEKYPQSKLANNAQFWIGECFYQEKSYQEAINAYEKVIENYPNGTKVKDAMLKQGMAFSLTGDKTAAGILFKKVINQFADSNQALIAKKMLEKMEE